MRLFILHLPKVRPSLAKLRELLHRPVPVQEALRGHFQVLRPRPWAPLPLSLSVPTEEEELATKELIEDTERLIRRW